MAPVNKKIQRLLPWLLAMALFGLFVFLLLLGWAQAEQRWQQHWLAEQARVQASLLSSQHDLTQKARLLAQVISEDKAVITLVRKAYIVHEQEGGNGGAALSQQLRTQLNAHLQPYWRHMEPAGVRQLNIHFGPSGTVFLRVQKPERFGDNTALFRPMVLQLLRQSEPVTGMEVGRFGSGYRALQPISPNDTNTNNHDNDNNNKVNDGVAIAAIEVGVALLPITPLTGDIKKRPKQPPPEQAVMLHPSLINNVLWDDARTQVQGNISTNSAVVHKQWGLESFTHPLIKEWLAKELLPTQLGELEQPWLLHYEDQDYLLCVSRPQYFSEQHALKNVAQVVVLNWQNVTPEFVAKKAERMSLASQYFAVLILAEAMLMLWFYYNHLQQEHIQRLGDQQLQQEQALTGQLQQQLSLLMEHTASGYWDWNISTNRAHLSKEWREFCGLPANNGGDTDIEEWLDLIHPSDKRASYAEMIRHIKGETPQLESEYRLRIADGSYKWVSTRGKVVEWLPNGRALLIKGIYTNITQRKNNEIAVVRQEAALTILSEIVSALEANAETQLHQALGMGARFLGLQSGAISAINGQQYQVILENQLTAQHPVSLTNTSTNVHLAYATDALSNHLCELTYQRKTVFACDHISLSEYRERQANPYKKIESYLGEPLWLNGEIYGTLSFVSEHIRHQPYDDVDKNFIRALARWVEATLLRWQQQKEQQVTLDRFNKLSENLPGFVFQFQLHPDGKSLFPYVSAGISAIYNLSADEVKHNATTLFNRIHKDDLGWISEAMSTSATKLTPWIATFRVHHRQRGEIWVHAEARPERLLDNSTLWHGFQRDVTAEKRAEIKLQEAHALREAIFDAAGTAIISTDEEGVIKTFNRGAEKMLGYSAEEMININTPSLLHLPDEVSKKAALLSRDFGHEILPSFEVFIARAREGDEDEDEWTYVRKDGSTLPILLSVTALRNAAGRINGYLGLARDISEIKRIDKMKSEFISTVSHELRTPLTSISGALDIIKSGAAGALPDMASKMLNIAHKNSVRLIHLVNDLLDMDKLEAGKVNFDMQAQLLLPIVQQAIDASAAYAAQYNVIYNLNSEWADDIRVTVDGQRLIQVLANLLSNAAKFSPLNDVVEVTIEKIFTLARVTVADKGPGISDEFRHRIFQKFTQADSSDSRQQGGTGLGLAISKEMMERMAGKIGFNSTLGQGAQFYIELPCEEIQTRYISKGDSSAPIGNRILVIEDDYDVAELIAIMLRTHNYRVDIAYSGQMALERLALYSYAAITLDLQLPDMVGIALIQQLRSDASTQRLPIVVISAHLDAQRQDIKNNSLLSGIQWLEKPAAAADVIAAIQRVL